VRVADVVDPSVRDQNIRPKPPAFWLATEHALGMPWDNQAVMRSALVAGGRYGLSCLGCSAGLMVAMVLIGPRKDYPLGWCASLDRGLGLSGRVVSAARPDRRCGRIRGV